MCVGMGNNVDCVGFGIDLERHIVGAFMKYISKERLETLLNNTSYITANDLLRVLINECQELNPWQPIETAPKDRRILLLYQDGDVRIDWWHHESQQGNKIVAWMEIPETPNDL